MCLLDVVRVHPCRLGASAVLGSDVRNSTAGTADLPEDSLKIS